MVSDLLIDNVRLSKYNYTVGLCGEHKQLATHIAPVTPVVASIDSVSQTPTWFQATFATPVTLVGSPTPALAVDFAHSSAKKGAVWVNGFMLGRYWDILASKSGCQGDEQCSSSAYSGAYTDSRCRTGCGERSQSLYKIPVGLLHPAGR